LKEIIILPKKKLLKENKKVDSKAFAPKMFWDDGH